LFFSIIIVVKPVEAQIQSTGNDKATEFPRSLESLRDLDYQTWQLVVYPKIDARKSLVLRVVGYPGRLRIDHPLSLEVSSGRKYWELEDITVENKKLSSDTRLAAAEFDLMPLLNDLRNNRPLRLMLPEVFSDLPVPPYLVAEWRSLLDPTVDGEKI
tara:strand:- start:10891 stop:11361 length:471 start_codon:yes stop_codon:yes gene_type:complete